MARGHSGSRCGGRRWWAALLVLAVVLTGCTYAREEPGLFPKPPPSSTSAAALRPTNPRLPVLGERVWTTGEGLRVTTRFALHAVRRVDGATVLDWSVTPVSARDLHPGDPVPSGVDFGLTRETGDANITLIDRSAGQVYRPLSDSQEGVSSCLCSPLWVAQLAIRLGETRLLQVSYPELPSGVEYVDVAPANVVPFFHVPVSPRGHVPVTRRAVDLARPAVADPVDLGTRTFPNRRAGRNRLQRITINAVVASPTSTTLVWTLTSVTDLPTFSVLASGPPVVARLPDELRVAPRGAASGPRLRTGGRDLSASWMTTHVQRGAEYECLCTGIGLWAGSLRRAGNSVQVVTTYGPLPPGTATVTVVLPTAGEIPDVPVQPAEDTSTAVVQQPTDSTRTWRFTPYEPPQGWSTDQWPTTTPDPGQAYAIAPVVEDLVSLPGVA